MHDTAYDTSIVVSLNCHAILAFSLGGMHDTTYNTPIVTSLTILRVNFLNVDHV
jgi:hypothetical protein